MTKKKVANLLWVDLEMTGLSPEKDRILEVAAIATDWDFEEFETYTAVVKVSEKLMRERMVGEFWEKNKASYDALMAQNASGLPAKQVEEELLEFVKRNCGDEEVYLADPGNGFCSGLRLRTEALRRRQHQPGYREREGE